MPFQKGNRLAGSRKGKPNKVSALLKEAVLEAAVIAGNSLHRKDSNGAVEYVLILAAKHPAVFAGLLGRILPTQQDIDATVNAVTRVIHQEATPE